MGLDYPARGLRFGNATLSSLARQDFRRRVSFACSALTLILSCGAATRAEELPDHPQPKIASTRVADKKFWAVTGLTAGIGLGDFAQHRKCRADHPPTPEIQNGSVTYGPTFGCREGNPLLGSYPSSSRALATGAAFHGAAAWGAYELKKRGKWYWWTPQAALAALHVYGIVHSRQKFPQVKKQRVADKKFWLLTLGSAGASILATSAGVRCRHRYGVERCLEKYGSFWGIEGVRLGVSAIAFPALAYTLKKNGERGWWILPASAIAFNAGYSAREFAK
jgi:hypothetical protein